MLDRLEHTLADADNKLSALTEDLQTSKVNMTNMTREMADWQKEDQDMVMSISEDIGNLESGMGYIPGDVHEHTTVSVTRVVIVVLAFTLLPLEEIWQNEKTDRHCSEEHHSIGTSPYLRINY